ncbi:MAG: phosphoribosyltransferase family protein [Planctomycetota bacterium]|nr:phosphoribosyltransferase family protein [Planctomycetota bacterium]
MHAFKYHARRDVLRPLGVRMARSARAASVVAQGQRLLVVPVPARRKSRRRRGYDQAVDLATGVASVLRAPLEREALRRRRQPALSQAETRGDFRRRQLRGSFSARPGRVLGRTVLLVDDVMSTGATVDAAARALGLAGAQAVFVLVLAG